MDGHQYLHYQSFHPLHIKTSIPYSQGLRVSSTFLSEKDFKSYVSHMKEWFLARGYPEIVANNQIDKVVFGRPVFWERFDKWGSFCYYLSP